MKHVVELSKKQSSDLLMWGDVLQINWDFSIHQDRKGDIVVRDERQVAVRRLSSMSDYRSFFKNKLLVPDAQPGDEIELVFSDGTTKSFTLPE